MLFKNIIQDLNFIACFCTITLLACGQKKQADTNAVSQIAGKQVSDTIHFEQVSGKHWIIIDAQLKQNIPVKLVVDNGTKWALYLDQSFALKNSLIKDSGEFGKFIPGKIPFKLYSIYDTAFNTLAFDLKKITGDIPGGLLGYDFLRKYIVEINYKEKYLYLHKPGSFKIPPGFTSIRMENQSPTGTFKKIKLSIFFKTGKMVKDFAVLDLGQGGDGIFIGGAAARKNQLLKMFDPAEQKKLGSYITSEENKGYELQADSINLGGISIRNIKTRISTSISGQSGADFTGLGNDVLSNFGLVYLDLTQNILFVPMVNR